MPILCNRDIKEAQELGLIRLDDVCDISATSLDIRIDQLLTPAMDEKDMKPVPLHGDGFWILEPGDFYLMRTVEGFMFAPGFGASIESRSSWARYGVAVRVADDDFCFGRGFEGRPICTISTLGTYVKVRPGDAVGQAHLKFGGNHPASDKEMRWLIRNDHLRIRRRGKSIRSLFQAYVDDGTLSIRARPKGTRINSGYTLTHDPYVHVYNGGLIDPGESVADCFEKRRLANRGTEFMPGTFFISSSAEEVEIPNGYVGWVSEFNTRFVVSGMKGAGFHPAEQHGSLQLHANAPKIDPYPRFSGKITFENYVRLPVTIRPGERLGDFNLMRLYTPWEPDGKEVSRYRGQTEATTSKGCQDAKER